MNKGEWSEPYALLSILAQPKINLSDKNLNNTSSSDYRVTRIYLSSDNGNKDIELKIFPEYINANFGDFHNEIPIEEISSITQLLFIKIKSTSENFSFNELDPIWEKFFNPKIKGSSGNKVDIYLEIYCVSKNTYSVEGFSIKSNLGSPTSLLNASVLTNFLYSTTNTSDITVGMKPKKMVAKAIRGVITEYGPCDLTYLENLKKISPKFDRLISNLLLEYFSARGGKVSKVLESLLSKNSSLQFQQSYLEIMSFLKATAFGMVPSVPWDQLYSVTGGMIVVKTSGEAVFFYLRDTASVVELDAYLYQNCRFDTASPSRHGFGTLFNGNQFKLNLLIRL
jgi:type II restriction enzyme